LPVSAIEAVPGLPGAYHVTVRCPAGSKRFSQRDRVQLATLPKDVRVDDGETWADVRKTMQSRGIDIATISMVDAGTVDRVHVARADEERGDDAVSLVVDVLDAKSLDLPVLATSFLITDRDMERAVYETSLRWLLRFGCYASVNPLFSSILLEPALCTAPPSNIVIDPSRLLDKNTRGDPQYKLQVEQAFNGSTLVLVRGCAGSGKSTLISDLIKLHADRGEKILLCAQSHVAVDQPLEKLASNAAITVLRLGILEKVTSKGRTFHSSCETSLYQNWVAGLRERLRAIAMEKGEPAFTGAVEALDKYNTEPPGDDLRFFMETYKRLWNVLAMTTYEAGKLTRIKDELDEVPIFDVAILDEASRATPLDFFAVSLYARKLYVVGDPNQLAPVFTDRDSPVLAPFAPLVQFPFFAYLLALAPPSMVIKMLKQHRQHSHPLRASNTFIELKYAGISSPELLASEDVTRDFPFKFTVKQYGKDPAAKPHFYIIDATGTEEVYPPASTAAMLGDGEIEERASLKGSTSPYNAETARVIIKTVLDMVHLLDAHPDVVEGFLGRSGYIVVITFYSEQKRYLQQLWYRRSMDEFKHLDPMKVVQFDTVDHFQGDQQAIVIVDVVVTSGRYSEFFCSYNRFYVGCSRARNLLIMVMAENTKRLIIPVGIDIATPPWLTGDDAAAAGPGTGRTKIERRAAFQELYDFAEELGSFISWKDIDEADTHHRPILKFDPSYRARDAADAEE
ncbi:MAG: AAA family ATPase, partial [Candidatus Lokiarchaeota archaeon]|nr:AAA family ATPase [Candidatus Lokiarchaeota archaeon]